MKRYQTRILTAGLVLFLAFSTGCYYDKVLPDGPDPGVEISFATDIQPVFTNKCIACHAPSGVASFLDLTEGNAYDNINTTKYIDKADPTSSLIYTKPAPNGGHGGKYSQSESGTVLQWIEQGAQNN